MTMRFYTLFGFAAALGLVLWTTPGSAHHSTNDIYEESETVEITGVVTLWRLVNPHPYLIVEVTGPDGGTEEWDVSFGGSAAAPLARRGYTPETFKPGEVIVVRGNPAKAEDARGILVRGGITREDGTPIP
jgi:hypothetical protein